MKIRTAAFFAALVALPLLAAAQDATQAKKADPVKITIYDEKADAKALIGVALKTAKKDNRRVLIQWGGNWCSWCVLLHDRFKSDAALARTLLYEYALVHIDSNNNKELAAQYGADLKKNGVPFLTVLDADGKVLVNQATEPFEAKVDGKNGHDSKKLQKFLTDHQAEPLIAEDELKTALAKATKSERMVFLHFGAPWCGWCKRLEAWMDRPEIDAILTKDFVEIQVDVDRMKGGQDLLKKYRTGKDGGIPWFVMLDANGKALITSDGPKGNIGFPAIEAEIDYFVTMLKTCKRHLTDADIDTLRVSLTPQPKGGAAK